MTLITVLMDAIMSVENIPNEARSPKDSNRIVQGLWVGSRLSIMEQLSIASFLREGHDYHLYTYNDLGNVPAGTILRDANEVLPASQVFQYKDRPSYAGFADCFRYKLLLERGGWWVDSDMVCLKYFDFAEEFVFSSEINAGQVVTNVGVIKAPAGSEPIAYAWQVCQAKDPNELSWGEIGPRLMAEVVQKYQLNKYQKPYYIFCPISDWHRLVEPYVAGIHEDAYAIHLWNSTWEFMKQDKDGEYHPDCIYEQLKQMILPL